MQPNSTHVGLIIFIVTLLIVLLLILCYKIKKYKNKQIKTHIELISVCMKSIDLFSKESAKLHKITDCLIKEMQEVKNSEVYKSYKNGNSK